MKSIYIILFCVAVFFIFILLEWVEITQIGYEKISLVEEFLLGLFGILLNFFKGLVAKIAEVL